ncbi:MAG: DUF2190 family protein [Rhodospirillaceae bacterium]|nr:DUF2190 family protein [Rhodospirillaceae bacterium]
MASNFVENGDNLLYTATAAISADDVVVVGQQIGIAMVDIANTETGTVAMEGVFTVPKVSAAVIAQGEAVLWDSSAGAFDDNLAVAAAGDVSNACTAWEAAGNGVTTIKIKLNTGKGTVA